MDGVKKMWYEKPTQVRFIDIWNYTGDNKVAYIGGIAYKDELICGVCGEVFSIPEFYDLVDEWKIGAPAVVPYETWIDLSEEITGSPSYKVSYDTEPEDNLNW